MRMFIDLREKKGREWGEREGEKYEIEISIS